MHGKKLLLLSFLVVYSLISILNSNTVFAQEEIATSSATPIPELPPPTTGFKLTVSPPTLPLRTDPGASVSAEVMIKSFSGETEDISVGLMKFKPDATGAKPLLTEIESADQFPAWVNISETQFRLEPEVWKKLKVTFSPPETAAPAYYFAIVFNRTKEVEFTNGQVAKGAAAILVLSQVASSRVYHQIDLAQLDGGKLGFKTDRYIYEFLPANFETSIINNGNVHELAFGNIFIDWLSGKKNDIEILDVNKERSYILPQTKRTFTSTWTNGFPHWEDLKDASGNPVLDKRSQPMRKLVWDFSKIMTLRIGKYRANLIMIYNDGIRDIPLEAVAEFWVIPWRILLGLLIVLLLIGFGFKGVIQSLYKRLKSLRRPPYPPQPPTHSS